MKVSKKRIEIRLANGKVFRVTDPSTKRLDPKLPMNFSGLRGCWGERKAELSGGFFEVAERLLFVPRFVSLDALLDVIETFGHESIVKFCELSRDCGHGNGSSSVGFDSPVRCAQGNVFALRQTHHRLPEDLANNCFASSRALAFFPGLVAAGRESRP